MPTATTPTKQKVGNSIPALYELRRAKGPGYGPGIERLYSEEEINAAFKAVMLIKPRNFQQGKEVDEDGNERAKMVPLYDARHDVRELKAHLDAINEGDKEAQLKDAAVVKIAKNLTAYSQKIGVVILGHLLYVHHAEA